jgi:vancomycin resistance protein YoaR
VPEAGAVAPTRGAGGGRRHASGRATSGRRDDGRRRVLLVAASVCALVFLATMADLTVSWGRIHPGVRVGEVAVGSMTPTEARVVVGEAFARASAEPVVVTWGSKRFEVTAAAIGARWDTTSTLAAAMAVGREGGVAQAVWDRVRAVIGGVAVAPVVGLDAAAVGRELDTIDAAVSEPARDASVSVNGTVVATVPSREGRILDRDVTEAGILAALVSDQRTVAAAVTTVSASVSDAEAERARQQAVRLVSGAVTVRFEASSLVIPRATVASWVVFSRETTGAAGVPGSVARSSLVVSLDVTRMAPAVASLTEGRARPARDAAFVAGEGTVRITPSQVGAGPDLQALASDLLRACLGTGARAAVLRLVETQPLLTTAAARAMGITGRISTFTTSYSTANPARTNNVHLLAKAFDGKLVAPGAVFSFNGTAGQRTAAKGYQEAPAIVEGKLVPQLGGGVCQVGTTFFNTVFFSGLPILERHNHSFYISHYPTGRDATVSWGGPDFKFRNDTRNWILIRTAVTASTLTIALYGTDPGYTVRYTTGPFTDVVPHETIEVPDPTRKKGYRVVEDGGVDGRSVVVVRTVYDRAGQVVRTDTFVSHYSPKTETVRVGTREPSVTPTGTVTP